MTAPGQTTPPTPERIFDALNAYQQTAALQSAIELDIFTKIGEGIQTAAALAERCSASEKGVRILCDYLTVGGFLRKGGGRYALAPDAAMFLDRRSPACLASIVGFLGQPMLVDQFRALTPAVRKGGTAAPEHPVWVEFARAMAPMMRPAAEQIAALLDASTGKPWKVLDIAAGHGLFGVTLAKHNPQAQVTAVDWAPVLELAAQNARAAGVAERYRTLPGSAFEVDFGTGYDVALLTNFLHHFDTATCESLLRKVRAALAPGGRAVTLEFVPDEDRVSPPTPAKFALIMLASTAQGDAYTFSEYENMLRNAGFSASKLHPLPGMPQRIIVSVK